MNKRWVWIGFLSCLSGCLSSGSVPGSHATPSPVAGGAIIGAAIGAAVAPVTSGASIKLADVAIGAGAGAGLGGVFGNAYLKNVLLKDDVLIVEQGEKTKLILFSDMFYERASPTLKRRAYPILDNVASLLKSYPQSSISINAYSDNVGSSFQQRDRTEDQAKSMIAYLWSRGVNFRQMVSHGMGNINHIASDKTLAGSAANRRIEIEICPIEA